MMHISQAIDSFMDWLDARIDYKTYLQSDAWKSRADAAKRRAGYRCQLCNRSRTQVILNVHHRTYERLGNEQPDDLTVLCEDCHATYESHRKKNAKRLKQESVDRMIANAKRARHRGGGPELLYDYVQDLRRLDLPEAEYREIREQISDILNPSLFERLR
jgi:hypothetical protein